MVPEEHSRIVKMAKDGELIIGIDRVFARKFFTDVPVAKIEEETGEAIYIEKAIVWVLFLGIPCGLIATAVFSAIAFHWWTFLTVPASVGLWLFYSGLSCKSKSTGWFISSLLCLAVAVAATNILSFYVALFFIALVLTLWMTRLLYLLSTFFLRGFVVRNAKAFSFSSGSIVLRSS